MDIDRRDFLKLMGIGGAVFVLGPGGLAGAAEEKKSGGELFFVQLSDTHWGFNDPKINPDAEGTLKKALKTVNSLKVQPDFIIFTGDLTHTTDDDKERRARLTGFRDITRDLTVKDLKFMPGEHDAGLDGGEAFRELFGDTRYTFDYKGYHFIVLDNVSDPRSLIGEAQIEWLKADLKRLDKESRIVVFTHRPLFDLYPDWDWFTRDGGRAMDLLAPFSHVAVFYGHIHQENHRKIGNIVHHAAKGLMYPLPAPGSLPKKIQVPWDQAKPYAGLGFREVDLKAGEAQYFISEFSVKGEKI
jgi:3',5'-cyclic AMP phosphodiesterase CpdA